MGKIYLLILGLLFTFSSYSQTEPIDNMVTASAPHVPVMQVYEGTGSKFSGAKFTYKKEENLLSLKSWMKAYPKEIPKYTRALKNMKSKTKSTSLSEVEGKMFDGFQAQYKMLQLIKAGKL